LHKVLQKFDIGCETKSVSTLLAPHFKLSANMSSKIVDEREYMYHVLYTSAVGSLMYTIVWTRLYLSPAVRMVSRYMYDPGKGYWERDIRPVNGSGLDPDPTRLDGYGKLSSGPEPEYPFARLPN